MPVTNMLFCNRKPLHRLNTRLAPLCTGVILALTLGGSALFSGTAAAQQVGAGAEWTTSGGTADGTRYSTLTDITPANVGQLKEEFAFQTGVNGSHMGDPLVVDSTLYAVTPYPNKLVAYDLNTGKAKWTYSPAVNQYAKGVNCCDTTNRGAAYANGKIVYNLLDNTTVAVDAVTGKQVWRTNLADPHTGVTMTGAPLIVKGKVFVGTSSGEMGVRGWVQALDLATGKKLWRAYTTGPDKDVLIGANFHAFYPKDQGKDIGATSWQGTAWKQGGSSVWAYLTYDAELDLLFYGTSQPGVWNPDMRPGDNKWGASVFARKPDTGEAIWAYQVTPHDNWDYDAISENIAVDQTVNGTLRKLLVHFDKNGFAYTFDRATGEILLANPFIGEITWANGVDLKTGLPDINADKLTHQGAETDNICPSALGAKGWEPGTFSPKTGLFYIPTFNMCMSMHMLKAEYVAGAPYMGNDIAMGLGADPSFTGELIAWDAPTGTKKWGVKERYAIYGGILSTAGGVVFYGTQDKTFKAIDASTGAVLFKTQLECSTVGNPISFTGPDGKQRIAVFSGVGAMAGAIGGGGACHSNKTSTAIGGGEVHVFKLP
jgi:alcohol dehydrogenase (cytochrome c)